MSCRSWVSSILRKLPAEIVSCFGELGGLEIFDILQLNAVLVGLPFVYLFLCVDVFGCLPLEYFRLNALDCIYLHAIRLLNGYFGTLNANGVPYVDAKLGKAICMFRKASINGVVNYWCIYMFLLSRLTSCAKSERGGQRVCTRTRAHL